MLWETEKLIQTEWSREWCATLLGSLVLRIDDEIFLGEGEENAFRTGGNCALAQMQYSIV